MISIFFFKIAYEIDMIINMLRIKIDLRSVKNDV